MGLHSHFSPLPSEDKTLSHQALDVNFCFHFCSSIAQMHGANAERVSAAVGQDSGPGRVLRNCSI